jgi:hypothetical protein
MQELYKVPIPMILHCPECGHQHIDEGEWATRPHKNHLCQFCDHLWKPAIIPTVGVINLSEDHQHEIDVLKAEVNRLKRLLEDCAVSRYNFETTVEREIQLRKTAMKEMK